MAFNKIINGFVIQTFDDNGKCTSQNFVAGDTEEFEDLDGEYIDRPDHTYMPLDMKQPEE